MKKFLLLLICAAILLSAVFSQGTNRAVQTVTVKITQKGYEPKTLLLKKDVLARVTFIRQTNKSCGTEIVLPDYGIHKPLPLHKPVTVEFKPTKEGELNFTCGMNMLRGKVVVQ